MLFFIFKKNIHRRILMETNPEFYLDTFNKLERTARSTGLKINKDLLTTRT